jgi:hypothetical protein
MATRARLVGVLCALGAAVAALLTGGTAAVALGTGTATVQTKASPSVSVGGALTDSAQLVATPGGGSVGLGAVPTGTMTFNLYGPTDATCSSAPVFSSGPITLAVQGGVVSTASSASYTVPMSAPGTYRWVDVYSGDANYKSSTGTCGDASETVQVTAVTPTLSTVASPGVQVGSGSLTDTATITGGKTPTGSITFLLFPPTDPTCSGNVVDAKSTVPVSNPASIVSQPFTPTQPGTYHWVALYTGDTLNAAVNGACGAANETVTVTAAPVAPGTTPGSPGTPGSPAAPIGPCDPQATAAAVMAGIAATLTGEPGAGFNNACSAGVRIVLRAKEIRPGNRGTPRHDGYTTMANDLTHISPSGPELNFTLNEAGEELRTYALSHNKSLTAFLIVHVLPDKTTKASETLQILTLG